MFTLTIVTPSKRLLVDAEIDEMFVTGASGELNILPGHAPLVTTLSTGIMRYRLAGETEYKPVALSWGYCEIHPTGVNVMAETAETAEEIDKERVHVALKSAEQQLTNPDMDEPTTIKYLRKIDRARVRIELTNKTSETNH